MTQFCDVLGPEMYRFFSPFFLIDDPYYEYVRYGTAVHNMLYVFSHVKDIQILSDTFFSIYFIFLCSRNTCTTILIMTV